MTWAESQQNKGNQRDFGGGLREDRGAPAGCVNTAARADHLPFADNERG